jgi:hypothetical protein
MPRGNTPDDAIRQRYADVLPDGQDDSELLHILADLDAFAAAPPPTALRQQIRHILLVHAASRPERDSADAATPTHLFESMPTSAPGRKRHMKLLSTRRHLVAAAVAIALLAALLTGGAAFALSTLDPGLAFQLGVPIATGPEYTHLNVTGTVGDTTITLSRAALTHQTAIIALTYDRPQDVSTDHTDHICHMALTSSEGDTFNPMAMDMLPGTAQNGGVHGSTVLYFKVRHLQDMQTERHLRLLLQACSPSGDGDPTGVDIPFEFTLPLQR